MAASDRSALVKEEKSMEEKIQDRLPRAVQNQILSFLSIGTKAFTPRDRTFTVKGRAGHANQMKYPTFLGNLFVLCSYMDRAQLTTMIAINLLHHIKVEEMLALADRNKKCLPIPVLVNDPHSQLINATPLQAVYAEGNRNSPNMQPDAKPSGLVERLRLCFENPAHADTQLAEWKKNSQKATEETMAPYVAAINNTCQQIVECKEISDDTPLDEVLTRPDFLQLDADFREALIPNPNHVVRSDFLFSMEIFLHLIKTFRANVNNDNVEDKSRPNLGGWRSRKSDALDAIVYPKLQARSQRCDLGIFKKGIGHVAEGQIPDHLDFTDGTPAVLAGIGSTHFFGFFGDKYVQSSHGARGVPRAAAATAEALFETCIRQKHR